MDMRDIITRLPFVEEFIHKDVTCSTNTDARSHAPLPRRGMTVIVAHRQTAGRGQRGNSFFSDSAGGLWCTILMPVAGLDDHFHYNRALSLAIAESIAECGAQPAPRIKWPNDIYLSDLKVCGILMESFTSDGTFLILGFGINVNIGKSQFPHELAEIATSMNIAFGSSFDIPQLCASVLTRFHGNLAGDRGILHSRYLQRLYGIGRPACVPDGTGVFETVLPDGRAGLRTAQGMEYFTSGPLRFIE